MPFLIQMCRILVSLEIYFPESIVIGIDAPFPGTVENGNTVIAADFNHCIYYFLRIASFEVLVVPPGEKEYLGCGIFLNKSFTKYSQSVFKVAYASDGVQLEGIIVPANYDDIV